MMVPPSSQGGPLSEHVWKAVRDAVLAAARHELAARRVASFDGPRGWDCVAVPLGTLTPCETREGDAVVCLPDVVPLAEIRAEFQLPWTAVQIFERGAPALDTGRAERAAREVACAEDRLAFYGQPVGAGFLTSPDSPRVSAGDWASPGGIVADLLKAVEALDGCGVPGPYEAVLSVAAYYGYHQGAAGGYPAAKHHKAHLAAVHRSRVIRERGAVFSTRSGDFILTVGGDLCVGYRAHDREAVHLFVAETVAARLTGPQAVCLVEG
jgi:uncharacterized linocin/CFP29 family protein